MICFLYFRSNIFKQKTLNKVAHASWIKLSLKRTKFGIIWELFVSLNLKNSKFEVNRRYDSECSCVNMFSAHISPKTYKKRFILQFYFL